MVCGSRRSARRLGAVASSHICVSRIEDGTPSRDTDGVAIGSTDPRSRARDSVEGLTPHRRTSSAIGVGVQIVMRPLFPKHPYVCEVCEKHFHQAWALESHQQRFCGFGRVAVGDGYLMETKTTNVVLTRIDNGRQLLMDKRRI